MKKNISLIFLLVLFLFGIVFAAYITAFKLYFSSDRLINATKHLSRMTFQRDIKVSGMSFSPFGAFNVRSFSMAAKGGFEKGILITINKVFAHVNLQKLLKRELVVDSLSVDGVTLKLNYGNKRRFDYQSFFSNIKFIFMHDGKKIGLLKSVVVNEIVVENAAIDLALDAADIKFKNISVISEWFSIGKNFDGKISFDFIFANKQYAATLKFNYNADLNIINISEIECPEFNLKATGHVELLEEGNVSVFFNVDADKFFFDDVLLRITGIDYLGKEKLSSLRSFGVDVVYLGGNEK